MGQATFWFTMQEGPASGQRIDIHDDEMVIGRDPSADIVIDSPAVSRRHVRIWQSGGQVRLQDLNSSNGTFINGNKAQGEVTLKPGDQVGLGRSVLLVLSGTHPQEQPIHATVLDTRPKDAPDGLKKTVLGDVVSQAGQPAQLEVIIAGGQPKAYVLDRPLLSIGRVEENDICVPSPIVSRRLAVIKKTPSGYQWETNPDITNPVLYEGQPLSGERMLRHGDQLRVGSMDPGVMVTLRFLNPSEVVSAPPQLVHFPDKDRITIGRDPENDIVLKSPQVSRYHAQVERVGQRYRVTDLRSTNGTFVNNQPIEGVVWLQPKDTLRIGANRFMVGSAGLSRIDESGGLRVEAVGLNKWVRKDLNLLDDISLVFQPREFVVVVGQSGGGKSTLVDAIAGYRPATAGKVYVNGIDVYRDFEAVRNEIGFVPQKDIIHMELTVYQALDYAARLRMPPDTTPAERRQRIAQVLDDLDLAHRKDIQISRLSGGQQKRVSIGVELLTQPGLFFLDEPTSGLDPGTETALMHLMRRLADQGRTVILITHATKNVMLADKVIFLARGGHLAWFGPPDEALAYFDQYRSERDRRAHPIEFDEIYAILDDPTKGAPAEWAKRFRNQEAYKRYIILPLAALGHPLNGNGAGQATAANRDRAKVQEKRPQVSRKQISGLRQFFILSARNVRILTRDRPSLVLMLAVAPIISMLDVILSFVLGRDLFNYQTGNMASVITSLFMPIMYAIMVGALAQMREFVKEAEIYRRERLVNLKVLPYVFSKVWVAALLALYQALVYTGVHYAAFQMPGGPGDFLAAYFSLYLATLGGMMLGLATSAIAPNANAVPLIVIMFLVPQFTLGGAMIPVPDFISGPTSARWAFESLMLIAGPGSDIAGDVCWALPEPVRSGMTLENKQATGCRCMGTNALHQSSCNFPGLGKAYDPVIDQPEPVAPADIGQPPANPVIPPAPTPPPKNADTVQMATYLQALQDYQTQVDTIQNNFKALVQTYQAKADVFKQQSTDYQKAITDWKLKRSAAVAEAEGEIKVVNDDFRWAFADKSNPLAYWSKVFQTWMAQGAIILVLLVVSILLVWRKDRSL